MSRRTISSNLQSGLGFWTGEHYNVAKPVRPRYKTRRLPALTTLPNRGPDEINQEQFDRLLGWLDADREKAAAKYESIRKRLIKIFVSRGSNTAEDLADITINRVAKKLPEIQADYVGEPAHYFCGVASFVFRESLRKERVPSVGLPAPAPADEDQERDYACLEKCMAKLPAQDHDLVAAYYQQEKHAKIDNRKKMAERLGLGMNALRIRACRIRAVLLECVEQCRSEGA